MKRVILLMFSMAMVFFIGQGAVMGQDSPAGDPESGSGSADPDAPEDLELEFKMRSEFHAFDNLDLRALDESSDQAIIDSDDNHNFAYSSLSAFIGYQVNSSTRVNIGLSHNGMWGEDQIGREAELVGALGFSHLSIIYDAVDTDNFSLNFSLGRQPFEIGGVPRDYILSDLVDALVVTADMGIGGALRILAVDFFTNHDLPDAAFARYIGGSESFRGLRGDTYTLRTGAIYENDDIVDGLDLRLFAFHADIGGGRIDETGADVSFGGTLGNFSDNDFVNLFGGRVSYRYDIDESGSHVRVFGEFANSQGIDRKEVVARDVEITGNAMGGGLEFEYNVSDSVGFYAAGDFYKFDGPNFAGDGLEFDHGFVGFKGKRVGGLNLGRYAGWYPSAHTSNDGFEYNPHDVERASGTQFIHGALSGSFSGLTLRADLWMLKDSGSSFLNNDASGAERTPEQVAAAIDDIDPPFGYSRDEFFAQARLGKDLGMELNVSMAYDVNDALEVFAVYGVFLPGEFYEIEINKVAGTALGSADPQDFFAFTAGASVVF
jgi:hypothetical protein